MGFGRREAKGEGKQKVAKRRVHKQVNDEGDS
jgi:hypothetical protein